MSKSNIDLEYEFLLELFAETVMDDDSPEKSVIDLEMGFLDDNL
jgi:hypothetical protein